MTISDTKMSMLSDLELKVVWNMTSLIYDVNGFDMNGALWEEVQELQMDVALECQRRYFEYLEQKKSPEGVVIKLVNNN